MGLSYDRRAPQALMEALQPGGWAHSLVEYGRSGQYAMDLQLRGYAGKSEHWATLYVGLTKVLDLRYRTTKGFKVAAHKSYCVPKYGWDAGWQKWTAADDLAAKITSIEDYLERVIPSIGSRYLKEGAVQSAISGFASRDLVVIDRETTIAFSNQREKAAVLSRLAAPLLTAATRPTPPAWWGTRPNSLGGECDALAVGSDGKLLAIEVKPATATGGITWAPLQVRLYADLLAEWAHSEPMAAEIIGGMVTQRADLGLVVHKPLVKEPLEVHPVIAIGRHCSPNALLRLREVQAQLDDAGLNRPPLRVASVTLAGRLDLMS